MGAQFEAKGIIKLAGDARPVEHDFFFDDAFGGDLAQAASHMRQCYPGIVNLRVRRVGKATPVIPGSAPRVIPAKPAAQSPTPGTSASIAAADAPENHTASPSA